MGHVDFGVIACRELVPDALPRLVQFLLAEE